MELVDMRDLGSRAFSVGVRVPMPAPYWNASIDTILAFLFCGKPLSTRAFGSFTNEICFTVSKLNTQKSKRSDLNLPVFHPFKSQ